jgi:hypothetical protein
VTTLIEESVSSGLSTYMGVSTAMTLCRPPPPQRTQAISGLPGWTRLCSTEMAAVSPTTRCGAQTPT